MLYKKGLVGTVAMVYASSQSISLEFEDLDHLPIVGREFESVNWLHYYPLPKKQERVRLIRFKRKIFII